jgi:hypothetical protein
VGDNEGQESLTRSVEERRKELKIRRDEVRKEYEKQFQRLYDQAVGLYRAASYQEALELFRQIEQMKPGYKRIAAYMKKAETHMGKSSQPSDTNVVWQSHEMKTRARVIAETLNALEQ